MLEPVAGHLNDVQTQLAYKAFAIKHVSDIARLSEAGDLYQRAAAGEFLHARTKLAFRPARHVLGAIGERQLQLGPPHNRSLCLLGPLERGHHRVAGLAYPAGPTLALQGSAAGVEVGVADPHAAARRHRQPSQLPGEAQPVKDDTVRHQISGLDLLHHATPSNRRSSIGDLWRRL